MNEFEISMFEMFHTCRLMRLMSRIGALFADGWAL